jgi:hypothetical protein
MQTRRQRDDDRVLATVLFTDIVRSTEQASEVGDRRWRELLDAHDDMVRRQLERFFGNEVKDTGDGFLATFDGPARGIRCAMAICDGARRLGVGVRAGLHAGELERRATTWVGSPCTLAAESPPRRKPTRCSFPRRSRIWLPDRASSLPIEANIRSRACQTHGTCSPPLPDDAPAESRERHVGGASANLDLARSSYAHPARHRARGEALS